MCIFENLLIDKRTIHVNDKCYILKIKDKTLN